MSKTEAHIEAHIEENNRASEESERELCALIVEDDSDLCDLIRMDLVKLVPKVTTLSRGDEAIKYLSINQVDLVLLDVHMPGATGIEVLKSIQGMPNRPLVVMVTGTSEFEIAREALQKGAFDYLQKPYTRNEFQVCMQKCLTYIKYHKISDQILTQLIESMTKTSIEEFFSLKLDEREEVLHTLFTLLKKRLFVMESRMKEIEQAE